MEPSSLKQKTPNPNSMKFPLFVIGASSLFVLAAHAGSIGINFGAGRAGANLDPGTTAGVVPQQNWNNAAGASGGPQALIDAAGVDEGATVTWATDEEWSDGTPVDGDGQLLVGWVSENGDPGSTIDVAGIPYAQYDLYVYMHHDRANEDTVLGEAGGAFPEFTLRETDDDGLGDETLGTVTFTQQLDSGGDPGNYAVFSNLTGGTLSLTLGVGAGARAPINGLQIVEVDSDDSDGDGLPDDWESVLINFDPGDAVDGLEDVLGPNDAGTSDFDMDGSPDAEEFARGTIATDEDSDNDGYLDGVEDKSGSWGGAGATGTDPLKADTDGDTLVDGVENPDLPSIDETQTGTDPNVADSDGDSLRDDWEIANGLDPTDDGTVDAANGGSGDPDMDDSDNANEQLVGTDPGDPDSDGDDLLDGHESNDGLYAGATATGTDPLNPDTDGDTLPDGVENPTLPFVDGDQTGTDPNLLDTDADSLSDGWEVFAGLDPTDGGDRPEVTGGAIGINFGAGRENAALDAAAVAGVVPQANWNNAAGNFGGPVGLLDDSGSASGATLEYNTDEEWSSGTPGSPDGTLLTGWIATQNTNGSNTITISAIPYASYDLYFYLYHDRGSEDIDISETGGAFPDYRGHEYDTDIAHDIVWIGQTASATEDAQRGNFVVFRDLSAGELNLVINAAGDLGSADRGAISGIQIVAAGPAAPFAITDITYDRGAGVVALTWNSEPGANYGIETSTGLTPDGEPGGWAEIDDFAADGPSSTYLHFLPDPAPLDLNYRIRLFDQ